CAPRACQSRGGAGPSGGADQSGGGGGAEAGRGRGSGLRPGRGVPAAQISGRRHGTPLQLPRAQLTARWTARWPRRWARRWPRRCSGTGETGRAGRFARKAYRGEGIVNGPPEKVWDCIKPLAGSLREQWDENVSHFEVIQSITDTLCVTRTATPSAAMKLISPRDFVDVALVKKYEDGTISSNATNVEHPSCPPKPGYVRGFNHPCGCFCEPVPGEPNKTNLVAFFQTDLSGYLPRSVVDSFFPRSMAGFYANLQKAVTKL
uniref:StAR related lipid transfer domain containing 5 n=1 Tax=Equus caballus TaxID=9796 RepID=A0A3Q2KSJ2_HORSE